MACCRVYQARRLMLPYPHHADCLREGCQARYVKCQKRTHETCSGHLRIAGDLGDLLPMLAIGARCHVGRGAVEGLGRFRLRFEDPA